ncbi:MAG: hypothetical protein E6Q97_33350 [Desulfurellales bacterium]|nr:MAG: hypothetical protein E6Q97_33350 [Desulfurellales bacterium]
MSNVITVWGNTGSSPSSAAYSQPSGGGIYPPNQIPGSGNPGTGTGTGPGGIGVGDGGFDTPSNLDFGIPVITFPNSGDNEDIEESDTVTSSAFDDGGSGATHAASRWMILYLGSLDDPALLDSPIYLYDSGVDVGNLTTLPLTVVEFEHNSVYAVRVRYKGNDNTWSRWSLDQQFSTIDCQVDPDLVTWLDFSSTTGYEDTGTDVTALNDLSDSAYVYAYVSGAYAEITNSVFLNQSLLFAPEITYYTEGTTAYYSAAQTVFMVGRVGDVTDVSTFLGQSGDIDIFSYPFGGQNYFGVLTGSGNTGSVVISSTANIVSPGYESPPDTLAAGDKFILEIYMQASGVADSSVWLNGAMLYEGPEGWGVIAGASVGASLSSPTTTGTTMGEICEIRTYAANLSLSQREAIRIQLAAKWGVSL